MKGKRLTMSRDEIRLTMDALQCSMNQIEVAREKHVLDDEELDRQKAEYETLFLRFRKLYKGY